VLSLFQESQHRIRSMALIHEQLYGNNDLARIDMAAYIRRLSTHLVNSFAVEGRVTMDVHSDPLALPIDVAIPCGLLMNELIANALKHAFPDGRQGTVRIEMVRKGRQIALSIADDGIGLPDGVDPTRAESLGLRLVCALADQLGTELRLRRGNGTAFSLLLPPRESASRNGDDPSPSVLPAAALSGSA